MWVGLAGELGSPIRFRHLQHHHQRKIQKQIQRQRQRKKTKVNVGWTCWRSLEAQLDLDFNIITSSISEQQQSPHMGENLNLTLNTMHFKSTVPSKKLYETTNAKKILGQETCLN